MVDANKGSERIVDRAAKLQDLVAILAENRKHADAITGLTTRRDELQRLVEQAEELGNVVTLLNPEQFAGSLEFDGLSQACDKLDQICKAFDEDPISILKKRVLDELNLQRLLPQARSNLHGVWRSFLGVVSTPGGIESILSKYDEFQGTARQLAEVRQELLLLSETLPKGKNTISKAQSLKKRLEELMGKINEVGLEPHILAFLKKSISFEGAPPQ